VTVPVLHESTTDTAVVIVFKQILYSYSIEKKRIRPDLMEDLDT
jgi:hypothetical protein